MAEKVVSVGNPTAGDLASFHGGEEQRIKDLSEFMQGTPIQEGGQHDMYARGLTTDRGEWQQPQDSTETVSMIAPQNTYVPVPGATEPQPTEHQDQDWRRLYGQSENEKGELRKALQQQMDANNQLLQQVQQFVLQPPTQPNYPSPQPPPYNPYQQPSYSVNDQYTPVAPTYTNPYPPNQPPQRFVNKADGEMVFAEDIDGAIRGTLNNVVAPVLYNTQEQIRLAREESAQLRQMMFAQEKEKRGISPQLEAQALTERPWIRSLQGNAPAYIAALSDFSAAKQAQSLIQRTQSNPIPNVVPQATVPATAASAARRITYVENSTSQTHEPGNEASAFDKELREAIKEPHIGKRAGKMREVFAKYGMTQVNDWRDPSVSPR